MNRFLLLISLLGLFCFNLTAHAETYLNYTIYTGDVDGDGNSSDYYFSSEPIYISVDDIHFFVDGPPTFALYFDPVTQKHSDPVALSLTDSQITSLGLITAVENSNYHILPDSDGNGRNDLLIQGGSSPHDSMVLLAHFNQLPSVQRFPANGELVLAAATLIINDFDDDSYLDLYIEYQNNTVNNYYVAYGNSSGQLGSLTSTPSGITLTPFSGGPAAFTQPSHDATVGATASKFEVGQDGSAVYTVPIHTPPSIGGLQPQLSLMYNSGSPEGMIGVGWGLGGLSVIHRCPTTWERDDVIDGVDFDNNDKFCLDGQRLVSAGGANEYRTENDGQTQIVATVDGLGKPTAFTVKTRDGKIFTYGGTVDSQIEAHGRNDIYIWALNQVSDRYSNKMTVTYEEESEHTEYRPSLIKYSSTSSSGVGPHYSVDFDYIDKTEQVSQYASGSEMIGSKLLDKIKILAGNKEIRSYQFEYNVNDSTTQNELTSITECAGSDCLEPTTFTWESGSYGLNLPEEWLNSTETGGVPAFSGRGKRHSSVDINGDGLSDWVWVPSAETYLNLALSNGSDFETPKTVLETQTIDGELVRPYSGDDGAYTAFVDVNGDGRSDMVWVPEGLTSVWVALADGTAFSTPEKWLDANAADGAPSHSADGKHGSYADLNGDGLVDKVWVPNGRRDLWAALSDGTKFLEPRRWLAEDTADNSDPYSGDNGAYTRYVDMNGDGMDDLVWVPYGRLDVWVAISDGSRFIAPVKWLDNTSDGAGHEPFSADGKYEQYVDVNGDGLPDKVWVPNQELHLWVSINTGDDLLPPTEHSRQAKG